MLRIVACDSRRARDDAPEVAAEQRHARAFDRDIRARAHRDADVGGGERRRVVDAVAGHGDDAALLAQALRRSCPCPRGRTSASISVEAELAAPPLRRSRDCRRSASRPGHRRLSARTPAGARRLDRVGDGDHAARPCRRLRRRSPSRRRARKSFAGASRASTSIAAPAINASIAERDRAALDASRHALAGTRSKPSTVAEREPRSAAARDDRGGERMLARALEARRQPQQHRPRRSPDARLDATTLGLPSVSVPVLSTTSVSTASNRSSASAFLISTPARAPRPTPTMIDIGVARPKAQGQAMISTETAATSPS